MITTRYGGQLPVAEGEIPQVDIPLLFQEASGNGVAYGPGLLVDFLEHEMLVAPLFGHQRRPVDMTWFFVQRGSRDGRELCRAVAEDHHLAVFHEDHLASMGQDGRDI